MGSISEGKFDTELNLPRCLSIVKRSEAAVAQVSIKPNKVGVIEDVEEFGTELEAVLLFESPILSHREVDVGDWFSSHRAFAQRAKLAESRSSKRGRIQVLRGIAVQI